MATVLVVDDEPDIRSMMTRVLQQGGHSVFSAGSSAQALSLFRSHRGEIDLLITDIVMREMDGPAIATKMQAECPGLPVLLMSGCCDARQLNNSFGFLAKPFSISDLLQRVRTLAERRQVA
jgi:two-component system, cell cycle sensor histidine kinase and response regulator CckA